MRRMRMPGQEVEIGSQRDVANSHLMGTHEDQHGGAHGGFRSQADLVGEEGVRILKLAANVMEENAKYAEQNRRYLRERGVRMLNWSPVQAPERQHCSLGRLAI